MSRKVKTQTVTHKDPGRFQSALTRLFCDDITSPGCLYDVDPYGTYLLAGVEGEVEHDNKFRVSVPMFEFTEAYQLDRAIGRMLLSIAVHMHRFMVVTREVAPRFLLGEQVFASPKARTIFREDRLIDAPGLPSGFAVSVASIEPENFGRLISDGRSLYGAIVFAPHVLSAVEIVATPWGHSKREPERLLCPG